MHVLGFDTATEQIAVGLGTWDGKGAGDVLESVDLRAPRAANTRLLPEIEALLARHGLEPHGIGALVVGRGPGSFTGVRIGVATAKGLAQGLSVPLFGVGTLDAVARRFAGVDGLVGVVGDAMRGEIYPALFRVEGGRVTRLTEDEVAGPREVAERWAAEVAEPLMLCGNGLAKHADVFGEVLGEKAEMAAAERWTPSGESVLRTAFSTCDLRHPSHPGIVLPVYTRLSDAEEAERRRHAEQPCLRIPGSGVAGPNEEARS